MKFVALLSGGKDSCFNILKCVEHGHTLECLAHLKPSSGDEIDSYMYQSVGYNMVSEIARALNAPLVQTDVRGDAKNKSLFYEICNGDEVEDLYLLLLGVKVRENNFFLISNFVHIIIFSG